MAKKKKNNKLGHEFVGVVGGRNIYRDKQDRFTDEEGKAIEETLPGYAKFLSSIFPDTYNNEKQRKVFQEDKQKLDNEDKRDKAELRLELESIQDYIRDNNTILREQLAEMEQSSTLLSEIAEKIGNISKDGGGILDAIKNLTDKIPIGRVGGGAKPAAGGKTPKGVGGKVKGPGIGGFLGRKLLPGIGAALEASDVYEQTGSVGKAATAGGGALAGGIAGAEAGAALGMIGGPFGSLAGGVIGGIGGSIAGSELGQKGYDYFFGDNKKQSQAIAEAQQRGGKNNITFKADELRFSAQKLTFEVGTLTIDSKSSTTSTASGMGGGGGASSGATGPAASIQTPQGTPNLSTQTPIVGGGATQAITPPTPTTPITPGVAPSPATESQKSYYDKMYNAVYAAAKEKGVPNPEVIAQLGATQTSLETGYGRRMVGNNAFGIKGSGPNSVSATTQEFVGGKMVTTKQNFRSYSDPTESAADYVNLLMSDKRYKGVIAAKNINEAIAAQSRSGYATDPDYGAKLTSISAKMGGGTVATNQEVKANLTNTNTAPVTTTQTPAQATPQTTPAAARSPTTDTRIPIADWSGGLNPPTLTDVPLTPMSQVLGQTVRQASAQWDDFVEANKAVPGDVEDRSKNLKQVGDILAGRGASLTDAANRYKARRGAGAYLDEIGAINVEDYQPAFGYEFEQGDILERALKGTDKPYSIDPVSGLPLGPGQATPAAQLYPISPSVQTFGSVSPYQFSGLPSVSQPAPKPVVSKKLDKHVESKTAKPKQPGVVDGGNDDMIRRVFEILGTVALGYAAYQGLHHHIGRARR
jgi:flagellum-specific peptidoglycan hydrolase FlgJ